MAVRWVYEDPDGNAKECLAAILDYAAYLRQYKGVDKFIVDVSLVITGVEDVEGLIRPRYVMNRNYIIPDFGASGFKPEHALNPRDNQARHFVAYLLAASKVGLRAPLGSYWRERNDADCEPDILLAWRAWQFYNFLHAFGLGGFNGYTIRKWVQNAL